MTNKDDKKRNGRFYTITNPFRNDLFHKWIKVIPEIKERVILEPFAGSNNILAMLSEIGITNKWACFDIAPPDSNSFPLYEVIKKDTIFDYPEGFDVAITNPPYLAKNSAKRDGIDFPETRFDDLYKLCLSIMLENTKYLAAIVPESFITSELFQDRIFGIISLTCKMFDDTDCPVCLALFIPREQKNQDSGSLGLLGQHDFYIYRDNAILGTYQDMLKHRLKFKIGGWKFNIQKGRVGLFAIDGTSGQMIHFCSGDEIHPEKVKQSSRGITRIDSELLDHINVEKMIKDANNILMGYRNKTSDVFLTSFRGLRKDGRYRRRLDFEQARHILSEAIAMQMEISHD